MKHPSPLPNRISAKWVASTRTHENWKKTGTLLLRLFLKKTLEKEAHLFYEGVLSPCSVFCHHVTRFLKGAESVGHWCISLQGAASFASIPYLTKLVSHGSVSTLFSHPLPASANSPLKMCFVTKDSPQELTLPVLLCNKKLVLLIKRFAITKGNRRICAVQMHQSGFPSYLKEASEIQHTLLRHSWETSAEIFLLSSIPILQDLLFAAKLSRNLRVPVQCFYKNGKSSCPAWTFMYFL